MNEIEEDGYAYEWAEYNLPAELSSSVIGVSPLAQRLFAVTAKPVEARMAWPFDLVRTPRLRVAGVVSELLLPIPLARP